MIPSILGPGYYASPTTFHLICRHYIILLGSRNENSPRPYVKWFVVPWFKTSWIWQFFQRRETRFLYEDRHNDGVTIRPSNSTPFSLKIQGYPIRQSWCLKTDTSSLPVSSWRNSFLSLFVIRLKRPLKHWDSIVSSSKKQEEYFHTLSY